MSKYLLFAFVFASGLADAQVTRLTFRPVDAGYSLALDRVIFISSNPNQLHIYNPATQADQAVSLAEVPLNLSVSPDGLHAAVAFSDAVAYVDLQAGTVAQTFSNVAVGTGKVVVGAGYVYVMPSYEGSPISIDIATGVVTTQQGYQYGAGGVFDSSVSAIYSIVNSFQLSHFDASSGPLNYPVTVQSTDSFAACAPLLLSRDGSTIYTGCGTAYQASTDPTQDMRYLGIFHGVSTIQSLSTSGSLHQIAVIPLASNDIFSPAPLADTVLNLYDTSTFNATGTLQTTPFVVNSNSFPAHGRWVFYNSSSSAIFLVTQADASAALEQDYAIENVNLSNANSCSAVFGSTSASAIAHGAYGTAQILSGQDCVFTAVSNVPWIVLRSGYRGSGNTALIYLVRPNLTANSRSGTITIGSQSYTVTQDARGPASALNPLSFKPIAADYDKALDKIVMVSAAPNELHVYDPVTQADQITPLTYLPLSVSVRPDGLFAAVGHSGRISIVDLQANSVSKIIPVPMNAGGMLLAGNGYAYAFPAEVGSFDNLYSVQVSTGNLTPLMDLYYGSTPRLDATGNYLYVSNLGDSKLDISNGPATVISTGYSNTVENLWLSEDGTRLIESDGNALSTSTVPSQDLLPEGRLSGTSTVDWAANSRVQHQTAVLTDPALASASAQLQVYGDTGLPLQRQTTMPAFTNGGTSYASHGKYVFWNAAASKLFVLTEADSTSRLISDFAEYTIDAPEALPACTFSISPSSLNVWSPPYFPIYWLFNVTSTCSWTPKPLDNWININSLISGFVTGNGQVIFTADQNSYAARSTSIVIGTQAVQVNEAASTCTSSISYNNQTFTQAGGTGQVGLMIGAGCPWSVESNASWLSVVSAQSGTGPANVQFSVAPNNTSNTTQTALLNIAGLPFYVAQTTVQVSTALNFVPVIPCRLFDTRSSLTGGPFILGGTIKSFSVEGACDIPPAALAYSLNITVIPHGPLSYITVWPDSDPQPLVSTLNSNDGRIKANAVIVGGGTNGSVSIYATNDTDLAIDVNGYFVDASSNIGLEFYPLTPCRLVDTRSADAPLGGPSMVAVQSRDFPFLQSACSLPSAVGAYSLNFTAVPEHGLPLDYISVWPSGQTEPLVSTLNAPRGNIVANADLVQAGTGGDVNVAATNNSDLVVDLNGYFAAPGTGGLHLYTVAPCRVLDTRATGNDQSFSGTLFVQMTGSCSIPSNAEAVVLNATAVPVGPLAYITLWPSGVNQPLVSTLNAGDGRITSNMAIVPLGSGGINAFATSNTHLILDVNGYFAP